MKLIREYTLPITGFTYYVLEKKDGMEITVGKTVYLDMKRKGKIDDR